MGEAEEMWLPERGKGGHERFCRGRVWCELRRLRRGAVRGALTTSLEFRVQGRGLGAESSDAIVLSDQEFASRE